MGSLDCLCSLWLLIRLQGPKLTFLGRRQVATETFFSVCGCQKVFKKFFLRSEPQIDGKLWSPIFLLRIRTKRTCLGPRWQFFPLTNKILKIPTHWLFIQKPCRTNQMLAISATAKCFKSTLYLLLCPTEKLLFSSLLYVQNDLDGLPCCSHQATTVQHFLFQFP